ncbi:uncharacterized protein LOC135211621 [Macrobrachium nipponense]|uniref:uncharacterized protein LOC135211621 n=1 Tax=Macrobrachium nipponense TaxID=159736 RepID=UPI0030C7EA3B
MNNDCTWNFQCADNTSNVSMTCSSFRLSSCTYSYMTITGQGLSKRYCGTKSTFTEVSGNDQMAVRFFSRTHSNYGFSCTVSCSGTAPNTTTTTTANTTMTVQCRKYTFSAA